MTGQANGDATSMNKELVVAAYKAFLNRLPEDEQVVQAHLNQATSVEGLLRNFINSQEFAGQNKDFQAQVQQAYVAEEGHIDVEVSEAHFDTLFRNISQQWTLLGETEPFWSVLSSDEFLRANFEQAKAHFYSSGKEFERFIDVFCERNHVPRPTGTCLEIGCGVGRITRYLAERFDKVIGVDVSEGNLSLCRDYLQAEGVTNVELHLLRDLNQLSSLGPFDFFYSYIVLQHNPPPIIGRILKAVLSTLSPGGAFLFQVPTHMPGYNFEVTSYLQQFAIRDRGFEMHSIPMRYVLEIIKAADAQVKEVILDAFSGCYGSNTFFGVK